MSRFAAAAFHSSNNCLPFSKQFFKIFSVSIGVTVNYSCSALVISNIFDWAGCSDFSRWYHRYLFRFWCSKKRWDSGNYGTLSLELNRETVLLLESLNEVLMKDFCKAYGKLRGYYFGDEFFRAIRVFSGSVFFEFFLVQFFSSFFWFNLRFTACNWTF